MLLPIVNNDADHIETPTYLQSLQYSCLVVRIKHQVYMQLPRPLRAARADATGRLSAL